MYRVLRQLHLFYRHVSVVTCSPGHAHQDEYSRGTWFQPSVWGNISGIETRYPHTLDSSCNYPRICFWKDPKIEITTKTIITQYLLQSANNYYQKYTPAAFYVNQWSSNGSLHSLLNPRQPKCITNISTIEGLAFRPWKKRGNWRPSGQFHFQTPRGSFRGFTAYPRPQTTIIIIIVIIIITIVHYIIWSMCVIRGGHWLQWYHNKLVQVVLTHPLAELFYVWGGCGCGRRVVVWGVGVFSVK